MSDTPPVKKYSEQETEWRRKLLAAANTVFKPVKSTATQKRRALKTKPTKPIKIRKAVKSCA
jgi:hypothetical protein